MTLPNQKDVEIPLLQEIAAMGGEARPEDLYPKLGAHFPQITDADLREEVPSGGNKWTNRIQWARQGLVVKGELERYPRGVWRITEKGRKRLGAAPPPPPPPPAPPEAADKLAGDIKILLETLVDLAKKGKEKEPLPSHDELVDRVKEMGELLGKTAEVKSGPIYKHDCVWKDNPYANPKTVIEACDKGNLDKDIASLVFALTNWGAKGILVVFEESDFQAAQRKLPRGSQIYALKAADMLTLHSLAKAGNIPAIRSIFGV